MTTREIQTKELYRVWGLHCCGAGRIAKYSEAVSPWYKRGIGTSPLLAFRRRIPPSFHSPFHIEQLCLKNTYSDMKSKAFFSDPTSIVDHMCKSLAQQNPSLRYDAINKGKFKQYCLEDE